MHEHEVALPPETLAAFGNDAFRARIFHEKYALRNADGQVIEHTPDALWRRVAQGIAAVEPPAQQQAWEAQFLWLL
jgi:ribonucleoside-diphosphate reductase alpha chain